MPENKDGKAPVGNSAPAPEKTPPKPGAVKRTPDEWAERLGLVPGGAPASDLPVGITAAVYSGARVACGWRDKPETKLTRKKFIDSLETWFRAPTPHTQARERRFHRRVEAAKAEAAVRGVS